MVSERAAWLKPCATMPTEGNQRIDGGRAAGGQVAGKRRDEDEKIETQMN